MEGLALSVVLLCLGCGAACIGVFGDTLREGKGPLLRRITGTGWLTFACASLMLLVGVFQEVRAQSEAAESDEQMSKISADAEAARKHLDELETVLAAITAALDTMKQQLASVGSTPGAPKEALAHLETNRQAIEASAMRAKVLVGSHFNMDNQRFDAARRAIQGSSRPTALRGIVTRRPFANERPPSTPSSRRSRTTPPRRSSSATTARRAPSDT